MGIAVMVLCLGTLTLVLVADEAAAAYADSVQAKPQRIQRNLDQAACDATLALVRAKDVFVSGSVRIGEFGCAASL